MSQKLQILNYAVGSVPPQDLQELAVPDRENDHRNDGGNAALLAAKSVAFEGSISGV